MVITILEQNYKTQTKIYPEFIAIFNKKKILKKEILNM